MIKLKKAIYMAQLLHKSSVAMRRVGLDEGSMFGLL